MKLCVVNIYENKIHEDEWRVVMQFSDPDIAQVTGTVKYMTLKEARNASKRLANALDHEDRIDRAMKEMKTDRRNARRMRVKHEVDAGFAFRDTLKTNRGKKTRKKELDRLAAIDAAIESLMKNHQAAPSKDFRDGIWFAIQAIISALPNTKI
jgi:hypothetical protein